MIEVCVEVKYTSIFKIPGLVQREGLVGLSPGSSLFLAFTLFLLPLFLPLPTPGSLIPCLILLSWRDLDCYSGFQCSFKGRHLCLV